MIGKLVVIDTLDNFKAKLNLIPSSAIVLIKDVGQIYAHGTYFGAQKTYSLLTKTADGLAPKGGTSASSLIKDGETEWVLTVTNGENPSWRKLPDAAFSSLQYTLPSATTSELGGIKVGKEYTATFDDLVGLYYKINIDKDGLAYVYVPWVNNTYTASGSGITLKDNIFNLSLNSDTKLDSYIGNKIYAVSLDKGGKLCVSVPWTDTNNIFVGATTTTNGSSGMVPAPMAKQNSYFLKGNGTWVKPKLSDFTDDVVNGKYLPLAGGTLTGDLYFGAASSSSNLIGVLSRLPSHLYRNVYDTDGNVYDHYYNSEYTETTNSYANLRVKRGSTFKVLRFGGDGHFSWDNNTVWHAGNDGSGSELDADLLDGAHLSDIYTVTGSNSFGTTSDVPTGFITHYTNVTTPSNDPYSILDGNLCTTINSIRGSSTYGALVAFGFGSDYLAIRRKLGSSRWGDWSKIKAGSADKVTVNNLDSTINYKLVFHDGDTLYSTGGIVCDSYNNSIILNYISGNLYGNLTHSNPQLCAASESDEIKIVSNSNGVITINKPDTYGNASIRKAIDFRWYDTHWQIGNIRDGGTDTRGFGITYSNNILCFRVTTSNCFVGNHTVIHSGNIESLSVSYATSAGNADTVDNYHISVGDVGTDSSTIYFVT